MKHMAIIPARLSSTRLREKPLQKIGDKALIVHVADEVLKTGLFSKVYVATDSQKIMDLFEGHKAVALMTDEKHESGTDRIFEASKLISEDFDTVFNIQGDEPFIYNEDLKALMKALENGAQMSSLYESLQVQDVEDKNKVKVLLDQNKDAIYFSRFALPFSREVSDLDSNFIGKHIGVYAYHKDFLSKFCWAESGYAENCEKLEQLRALQMGQKIKMIFTQNQYQGVDTEEDLKVVNLKIQNENK